MKKITKYKLQVTKIAFCVALRASSSLLGIARKRSLLSLLSSVLLSAFCIIANAQTDKARILDSATIQKNELKITPEMEEIVVAKIKSLPESAYSYYGIKNKEQLDNLQLGKPIPWYDIVNEEFEIVYTFNVSRMADGKPFSLRFTNVWNVPIMSDSTPLLFGQVRFSDFRGDQYIDRGIENTIEHFHNYEHKDSVIGSLGVNPSSRGMDFLIINKENTILFVQVYDEATGEYFKNEYSFSEIMNPIKELDLHRKAKQRAKQSRYYDFVADKSELILTPEITEMLITQSYTPDEKFVGYGIKNRAQLENLHLGKPIPQYTVDIYNENLIFTGKWHILVMSDGEHLFRTSVQLEDDGQYRWAGSGSSAEFAAFIQNYEYKDLLIGFLHISRNGFLIFRRDNKDIFVKEYDWKTGEYYKTEYSLSEIINHLKK